MTRTVLIVGPFYGRCDFAPSPAMRLAGYARHLPESGWRAIVVAPACRCTVADSRRGDAPAGSVLLDVHDPYRVRALRDALDRFSADEGDVLALRPVLQPTRSFAAWSELSHREASTAADVEAKMSWHLTPTFEPRPSGGSDVGSQVHRMMRSGIGTYVRAYGHQAARSKDLADVIDQLTRAPVSIDATLGSHGYAPEVRAAVFAAERRSVPLVVELRDAIWRRWKPAYEIAELGRVARAVRSADAVVHVTPQEQARDRWWVGSRPTLRVIEHGFEAAEWEPIHQVLAPDPSCFTIRFLGTLYPHLHLERFLLGYARFLRALNAAERLSVRFEYVGPSTDLMRDLNERCVPADLRSAVETRGAVPRTEALRLMASADELVLPMEVGIPGGRFYEYLGSRRPIIAFGDHVDPYVADVLRRTGAGTVAIGTEQVASVLEQRRQVWREGEPSVVDEVALGRYTRARQAAELGDLLTSLLRR
jgi:hypothetical protein